MKEYSWCYSSAFQWGADIIQGIVNGVFYIERILEKDF